MIRALVVLAALVVVAWLVARPLLRALRRRRREQALRDNPPPLRAFEAKLPAEIDKSNLSMTRVWGRLLPMLAAHREEVGADEAVARNFDVLRCGVVAVGKELGQKPLLTFICWAPEPLADRVELELTEAYGGNLEISELLPDRDPLGSYVTQLREREAWEQQAQAAAAQPDDDGQQPDEEHPEDPGPFRDPPAPPDTDAVEEMAVPVSFAAPDLPLSDSAASAPPPAAEPAPPPAPSARPSTRVRASRR